MKKAIGFFFLFLGAVYIVSALMLWFGVTDRESYDIFFGLEVSKGNYVLYKLIIGALLMLVAYFDLRRKKQS